MAIDLITEHIRMKLQQPELRRIYRNLELMPSNFQIRGMHTLIRDRTTSKADFVFYADRLLRLVRRRTSHLRRAWGLLPSGSEPASLHSIMTSPFACARREAKALLDIFYVRCNSLLCWSEVLLGLTWPQQDAEFCIFGRPLQGVLISCRWWSTAWGTCRSGRSAWCLQQATPTLAWTLRRSYAGCPSSAVGRAWRMRCAPAARASRLARSWCTGDP